MKLVQFPTIRNTRFRQVAEDFATFALVNGVTVTPRVTYDEIAALPGGDDAEHNVNLDYDGPEGSGYFRIDVNVMATEGAFARDLTLTQLRRFLGIPDPDLLFKRFEAFLGHTPTQVGYVFENPPPPKSPIGKLLVEVDGIRYFQDEFGSQLGAMHIENNKAYKCVPFNLQLGREIDSPFSRAWKELK